MKAKKEAKELVEKFYDLIGVWVKAKKCALIALDEIIDECSNWSGGSMNNGWDRKRFDYLEEVKQEINEL